MLPLFIAVLMVMMARIEHSHNGWKQCLALPIGRAPFYLMKFAIGVFFNVPKHRHAVRLHPIGRIHRSGGRTYSL